MPENKTADAIGNNGGVPLKVNFNSNGTHRLILGEQPHAEVVHKDLTIGNATMSGLTNYVVERAEAIRRRAHEAMVKVNTGDMTIQLLVGEHGARRLFNEDNVTPVIDITGSTKNSQDYKLVKSYMKRDGHSNFHQLAMDLRANAHLFVDLNEAARVVTALRSVEINVNSVRADTSVDNKSRAVKLESTITNAIELGWNWKIEMFEGEEPVEIPVRAVFMVEPNGADVNVAILDASGQGITLMERLAKRELMQKAAEVISDTIPDVPLVYVD